MMSLAGKPDPVPRPRLVSVVIPVGDDKDLDAQLKALSVQSYAGEWELILSDNRRTGGPLVDVEGRMQAIQTTVIRADAKSGSSYARNIGAAHARGDLLAFCDADDVVGRDWLCRLVEAAAECDLVAGRLDPSTLNEPAVVRWRPSRPTDRPVGDFLPFAPSSSMAIWHTLFDSLQGFREDYPKSHDVEFSWRAQLRGLDIGYAPEAVVAYRYRSTALGAFRQAVKSGRATVQLHRDFRNYGHPGRRARDTASDWAWLGVRLPYLLMSRGRRGIWIRRAGEALGRLLGSAGYRTAYL